MIETLIVIIALAAGLAIRGLGLPPMIGYLVAGFLLPLYPPMANLDFSLLSSLGITLLLFTIGLKLNLKALAKAEIWAVSSLHMLIIVGFFVGLFSLLKIAGWTLLAPLAFEQLASIGFALSFSSTVFAVKVLEERGEMNAPHGKIAIGILVMQDIIAVVYLTLIGDKVPSPFAGFVLALILARPLLNRFLTACGHGELLTLAGFALAFGGALLFESVGLKGDLGALFIGAVIAGYSKSNELSKHLLNFKDILLIGFFLSIGQAGLPTSDAWLMAGLLTLVLILKPLLFLGLLQAFKLRLRTAFVSALTLNNYSEFGLIVAAIAVQAGLMPLEWSVIVAVALSLSYVLSSVMIAQSTPIYSWFKPLWMKLFSSSNSQAQQGQMDLGGAKQVIIGMGRVGSGAYDYLSDMYNESLVGLDENIDKVEAQNRQGRKVLLADASDPELWPRMPLNEIELLMLSLSNHQETVQVAEFIRQQGYRGQIAATAKYPDEVAQLKKLGVIAFNFYAEAGAGFAEHVHLQMEEQPAR